MIKVLLSFLLLVSFINGAILEQKIENLIDSKNYIKHKNLVDSLTKDRESFYVSERLNYSNILNMLNENGLLKLRFDSPKDVKISFSVDSYPMLAIKILKDTLSNLGYSYYFTDYLSYDDNKTLKWKISFKSEYMLDPYIFNKELSKNEAIIIDIQKLSETSWGYKIDVNNAKIAQAIKIEKNEKVKLLKPLKAYLLRVKDGKQLRVISRKLNHWFPSIIFYSKDLNVLGVVKKSRVYRGVKVKIPNNTYYIRIDDVYTLLNIKRGLTIIVE